MPVCEILDRRKFEELWREDQLAEDDGKPARAHYQHPDGEMFQVADINRDGSVVTDSQRTLTASEFNRCERVG
jgi:hypothetical protein